MISSQKKCHECNGSGWVRVASTWDEGDVVPDRCWECGGTGEYSDEQDAEEQRQPIRKMVLQ